MTAANLDMETLAELLAQLDAGKASTRPVSVALPVPLAEALSMLVEAGLLTSTSSVASGELERVVRNVALRLQLDDVYDRHPDLRPDEETVEAARARNREVVDQDVA